MSPFIKAGILEDGVTGQGSVISPLLGNIYLHYVFDLWAERWRRQKARGDLIGGYGRVASRRGPGFE
jgi:RNA-directed DNA polymerase